MLRSTFLAAAILALATLGFLSDLAAAERRRWRPARGRAGIVRVALAARRGPSVAFGRHERR